MYAVWHEKFDVQIEIEQPWCLEVNVREIQVAKVVGRIRFSLSDFLLDQFFGQILTLLFLFIIVIFFGGGDVLVDFFHMSFIVLSFKLKDL